MKLEELFLKLPDLEIENLSEDFAHDPAITIPSFSPKFAKVIGTYDGHDVWGSRYFGIGHDVYAFRDNDETLAFVVISTKKNYELDAYPLNRIWTNPKHRGKGFATALVMFVTQKLHNKILIDKDEKLTVDSWKWLIKSDEKNRLKVIDVDTSKLIKAEKLRKELKQLKLTSTSLVIESTSFDSILFGTGYRILNEMPTIITKNSEYE